MTTNEMARRGHLTLASHFKVVIYSVHREEVYGRCPHLKRIEMRVPIYHDGRPANLPAAILDAEYWLRWLRNRLKDPRPPSIEWNKHKYRLHLAIKTLEEFLPDEELPPEIVEGLEERRVNPALTPVQQAKFDLIKEKLRVKQQAMRATE